MSTILHIDGLVASVGEKVLASMFSQFGQVLSVHIYLRGKANSSGIGTVEMESLEGAQKAVSALHRSYVDGLLMLVFLTSLGPHS